MGNAFTHRSQLCSMLRLCRLGMLRYRVSHPFLLCKKKKKTGVLLAFCTILIIFCIVSLSKGKVEDFEVLTSRA